MAKQIYLKLWTDSDYIPVLNRMLFFHSAGIGRTGVLITMETAMCLIEANQPVHPLSIVRQMRDQRAMLIQTPVSCIQFLVKISSLFKVYLKIIVVVSNFSSEFIWVFYKRYKKKYLNSQVFIQFVSKLKDFTSSYSRTIILTPETDCTCPQSVANCNILPMDRL